jgi:UDP-N-acetyl-D-galactosamine dehydrogenase
MGEGAPEQVGVLGLGYVGLPLAVAFAQHGRVVGFDISEQRVADLNAGIDATREADPEQLRTADLHCTTDPADLAECTAVVVAVPTPVDRSKSPDLTPLRGASHTVGRILKPGMLVVYESTVYPGVTEKVCLPILEEVSGLRLGEFELGYSPERINPGDAEHSLANVVKIVSGNTPAVCDRVAQLYRQVVKAGVHQTPNIMTAEAAKVIENIQRDLNIALMNELSKIFSRAGLNTDEVLAAAGTKWNFHRYTPGLVGGHCIGVDPYYLTHLAFELDMHPRVILAGRETNDGMGRYVAGMVIRELSLLGKPLLNSRVLLMGLTFKEDVPDCRNSRAVDVVDYLKEFGVKLFGCEPLLPPEVVRETFDVEPVDLDNLPQVDAVVVLNRHRAFQDTSLNDLARLMSPPLLFDLKNLYDRYEARDRGIKYLSL